MSLKKEIRVDGMAQGVEYLPSKHEVLSSNLTITKKGKLKKSQSPS
jgi:hypothetical protein